MDYTELLNALLPLILNALAIVFASLGGYAAYQVKKFLDTREKRALAETTVAYVNQVGKLLGNEEKFKMAKKALVQQLNDAGIKFTELELNILIEATVNGFKSEYAIYDEFKITEDDVDLEEEIETV